MFKRVRIKITASVVTAVTLVFLVLLITINAISYNSMKAQNASMLERFAEQYGMMGGEKPEEMQNARKGPPPDRGGRMYDLSTFYSVEVADGKVIDADNGASTVIDREELSALALKILDSGRTSGSEGALYYLVKDKGDFTLVAFIDGTVATENLHTLVMNTAIAGVLAVILLFVASLFITRRIVRPLEENDERQRQFVSDAGHELKTPVAVISANTELLSRQIGDNEWLSNVKYETERMGTLITQLLDLSHAENATPVKERVDLTTLITGEVLPFESIAFERGLSLNVDAQDGVYVEGDRGKLSQLIAILTDNAIRHSTGGTVDIRLSQQHKNAVLAVENDGEEIPPEKARRLFERFYRVDEARSGEDRHYGLGLAIAKAIVEAHGGSIGVSCKNGKVIFTVTIPT